MMKPLKGNKNVEVLFSSGKRVSSSFLHCVYLLNKEDSRFVVSVPKKNFSLAVDRNKINAFFVRLLENTQKRCCLLVGVGLCLFILLTKLFLFWILKKTLNFLLKTSPSFNLVQ